MSPAQQHPAAAETMARYLARTKRSAEHDREARKYLPGGDTRTLTYVLPHPPYMARGAGARVYDADGNEYLDCLNNYTSLVHGHGHPATLAAVKAQLDDGAVLGAPGEIQYRHARHLTERIPSLERVRYANSGTEATMFAIRAARAFTGRMGVVKMDGGYHGSHDAAEVNIIPDPTSTGRPQGRVEPGVPPSVLNDVLVAPFNDLETMDEVLSENAGRVAAVIVEPIIGAGGLVMPQKGYLAGLRDLTGKRGVLLILDEIITFRVHYSGYQGLEGVRPDLTTLGKIIGGGLPVGAFGGREDVMDVFNPHRQGCVLHSGTFNGSNAVLAGGLATLEALDEAALARVNALGDRLRDGLTKAFLEAGFLARAGGLGSLAGLRWTGVEPTNSRQAAAGLIPAGDFPHYLHLELMNQGVYSAARGMFVLSTPMTEADIDFAVDAMAQALDRLKPYARDAFPALLRD
ncbi:MAG: aspartate aminotransferase family protein [Pseudomonadota bacterium]